MWKTKQKTQHVTTKNKNKNKKRKKKDTHSYLQLRPSKKSSINEIPKSSEAFVHSKRALMGFSFDLWYESFSPLKIQ